MESEKGFDNFVYISIEDEKKDSLKIVDDISDAPPSYTDEKSPKVEKKVDKYDIKELDFAESGPSWSEMSAGQKTVKVLTVILGVCTALSLLYIFICSLDVLTSSFQLLTGRIASSTFSNSVILNNPIAGLMLGVLVTVLLQSSSTSTSIVVTLVGSGVLTVDQAVYVIMGANIGTSVTNTIVSMTQSTDKETFRRSFAGATVHDMFNWLTVVVLLPLQAATGYLVIITGEIVKHITPSDTQTDEPQFLKVITTPLTNKIVQVDKSVLHAVAMDTDKQKYPLCKYYCEQVYDNFTESWPLGDENDTYVDIINDKPWTVDVTLVNDTEAGLTYLSWFDLTNESETCSHLFTGCGGDSGVPGTWCHLSDESVGGILLACSLFVLLTSIVIMVKVLNGILKGPMARAIRVGVNADLPGKASFLTGYLAMLTGTGLTMLVQSSSVFTSTLTPLVGMGLIGVSRMYPLTLGANVGTCLTGVLAALASDPAAIRDTLQVALSHLFFNLSGILLYYPVPYTRKLPLNAAKFMGNTTAKYRWFALAYIVVVYFLVPAALFALSLAGWRVVVGVVVPVAGLLLAVAVVKMMQHYCPERMHPKARDWKWLPKPLRSLEPLDQAVTGCCYNERCVRCRRKCCRRDDADDADDDGSSSSSSSADGSERASVTDLKRASSGDNVDYADPVPGLDDVIRVATIVDRSLKDNQAYVVDEEIITYL